MSDMDNSDLYEGTSGGDAPLVDSLGSAVKRLIDKGRARGFITMEELNKALPSERESSEYIEDIMTEIADIGISIISESDADMGDADSYGESSYDDADDESGNFDEKELGRSDDPVRMYLREMGSVELLSRDGEIAIAKRIEAGKTVMIDGLCESPMTISAITSWRDELLEGTMQLRDIVDLEMMYGDDVGAMEMVDEDTDAEEDLDKVAQELDEKENLEDIDEDLSDDMELDGAVDDADEDEVSDDNLDEGEQSEGADDDAGDGISGRSVTSISAMEEALKEPVLEILSRISSYYDDLKKNQSQRLSALISGKKVSSAVEKK
jgi:RNA polymerase primary sigma factor